MIHIAIHVAGTVDIPPPIPDTVPTPPSPTPMPPAPEVPLEVEEPLVPGEHAPVNDPPAAHPPQFAFH